MSTFVLKNRILHRMFDQISEGDFSVRLHAAALRASWEHRDRLYVSFGRSPKWKSMIYAASFCMSDVTTLEEDRTWTNGRPTRPGRYRLVIGEERREFEALVGHIGFRSSKGRPPLGYWDDTSRRFVPLVGIVAHQPLT